MSKLTAEQQDLLDATKAVVRNIAMVIVRLPREQRGAQYAIVRRNFENSINEHGLEGKTGDRWLDGTMAMLQALVAEIDASGGARGGRA